MGKRRVETPTTVTPTGIIVAGYNQNHESIIANCVAQGYGGDLTGKLSVLMTSCASALQDGAALVVHSYAGAYDMLADAVAAYRSGVLLAMPLGSNEQIELSQFRSVPCIVLTGGSATGMGCTTGYGDGLEFWDTSSWSSNANGIVAGKLMRIKETLGCSWWEARHRARATAFRTVETHPTGETWNKYHGYGKIQIPEALSWTGVIPADPYITVAPKGRKG